MNKKLGILFPGQGIQYVGILNQFISEPSLNTNKIIYYNDQVEGLVKTYDDVLFKEEKIKLSNLLTISKNETDSEIKEKTKILSRPTFSQPATSLFSSIRFSSFLKEEGKDLEKLYLYGRSLGECVSILESSNLSQTTKAEIVFERGRICENEINRSEGIMVNIISDDSDRIVDIVNEYLKNDHNLNSLIQIAGRHSKRLVVLSGEEKSINNITSYIKTKSIKERFKVIFKNLNVKGAYHSSLMKNASDEFYQYVKSRKFDFLSKNPSFFNRLSVVKGNEGEYFLNEINQHNEYVYKLLSIALVNSYNTDFVFSYLKKIDISTYDLSMKSIINYNDYI